MASTNKTLFVQTLQANLTTVARLRGVLADAVSTYFDRGFNGGGSNPIVDNDVTALNIKAADVTNAITLMQQFANFLGNVAVVQGNYQASLDNIRTDT